MKKIITSTALLILINNYALASDEFIIKNIRSHYNDIRQNMPAYHNKSIDIFDESSEGATATAYYDKHIQDNNSKDNRKDNRKDDSKKNNKEIKLIEASWFGESGRRAIECYFHDRQLVFVFEHDVKYNRPIYWDKEKSVVFGDSEFFDKSKSIVKENRYYFHKNLLIRWLNHDKKRINITLHNSKITEENIMNSCYTIVERFQ